MVIDAAIRTNEPIRTISGLILTPFVASLKKVRRPALEAGMGALLFLSLIGFADAPRFLSVADQPAASLQYIGWNPDAEMASGGSQAGSPEFSQVI